MTAQILVVDDEPDMKALVLQKFRHQIRDGAINFLFASDGIEAMAMLEANGDIDMVVADINMPRMDGLTLLQKLRETTENISTIIVSAYGDMSNIRTAMNRGAFDFVTKPIDFADLEKTIAKTVRHVEYLREARQRQAAAERAHASLSRYFSPNLAKQLANDTDAVDLGGQRREIATVFSDVAGFTALVETLEPSVLAPLLNDYLSGLTMLSSLMMAQWQRLSAMPCMSCSEPPASNPITRIARSPAQSPWTHMPSPSASVGFAKGSHWGLLALGRMPGPRSLAISAAVASSTTRLMATPSTWRRG